VSSDGGSIRFEEFGAFLAGCAPIVEFPGSVVDLGVDRSQVNRVAGDVDALGRYSRTMRLRFSLLPRSHGEGGWAKYTVARWR
jgi:hypothetical protein